MHPTVETAAQQAESSRTFRVLARGGYLATALTHLIIGGLVAAVAITGDGGSGHKTALAQIASVPLGEIAIWVAAGLLGALGLFQLALGFARSHPSSRKKWAHRFSHWGPAVAYLTLGTLACIVALGDRSRADTNAEEASRGVLGLPGGALLLALVGLGVVIAGVVFIVIGVRRGFAKQVRLPAGALGTAIAALGVVGYIAKGTSVAAIGALLVLAAMRNDPEAAGALDGAIRALRELPGGPVIVAIIGSGFVCYAVFLGFRARYAKL